MAAPLNNRNHLKYPQEKVKRLFSKAIKALKKDDQIFNYPGLHRAAGLKTLRTLPYLAKKYENNTELMELWESLQIYMNKNLQKHIEESELKRQSRIGHIIIEFA